MLCFCFFLADLNYLDKLTNYLYSCLHKIQNQNKASIMLWDLNIYFLDYESHSPRKFY